MPETAAERAAELLQAARDRWLRDFAVAQREGRYIGAPSDAEVAALMADPDLLVDLAIEAGVSVGAMFERLASRCTDEQAVLL